MAPRLAPLALVLVSTLGLSTLACKRDDASDPPTTQGEVETADATQDAADASDLEAIAHAEAQYVGRELPAELTGELRDAEGRIVMLAPGFVAVSTGVDCGAPTYLWFLAVRCKAEGDCEVLTESCEGSIVNTGGEFTLAFDAVGEADGTVCVDYTGTFRKQP